MLRKIPVRYVPVIVRFHQLVTTRHGCGIEQQDPTDLCAVCAAEAHGREHRADGLVCDSHSLSTLQQHLVGSSSEAILTSDTDVGERRCPVDDLPKPSVQSLLRRFQRFSRHAIMVQFNETQQGAYPELTPNERRAQAGEKIARPWTELFRAWDHRGANRFVEIKSKS